MNYSESMFRTFLLISFLLCPVLQLWAGDKNKAHDQEVRIDSIVISKNWRTRDKIIMRELEFSAGDVVSIGKVDTSMKKIWNI